MKKIKTFSVLAVFSSIIIVNSSQSLAQVVPASEPGRVTEGFKREQRPEIFKTPLIEINESTKGSIKNDSSVQFYLEDVVFVGNDIFSDAELAAAKSNFTGKEVTLAEINSIANVVTVKYRNSGYISSKAIVPPQKVKNGVIKIEIIEGGVDRVIVEGANIGDQNIVKRFADKIKSAGAMSSKKLERYLLLIDDLPGITARAVLKASPNRQGYSDVYVKLEENRFNGSVGVDNYSSRFLGSEVFDAQASINSPFGNYGRTTIRTLGAAQIEELKFISLQHEAQVGDEGMKVIFGTSYTDTEPGQKLENLNIEGESFNANINFQNPVIRSRQENLYTRWGFNYKTAKSDTFNVQQFRDEVRTIDFGVTYDVFDRFYGTNNAEILLTKGLQIMDATEDTDLRSRSNADGNFERVNFAYTRIQSVPDLPVSFFAATAGQYAWSPLLSSEEFGVGGRAFGRGFDPSEISGDVGVAGSFEVRYSTQQGADFIKSFQPFAFYDVGKVWNKSVFAGEAKSAALASAGIGARLNFNYDVSGELLMAVPLTRDIATYGTRGDEPRFLFNLIKRF